MAVAGVGGPTTAGLTPPPEPKRIPVGRPRSSVGESTSALPSPKGHLTEGNTASREKNYVIYWTSFLSLQMAPLLAAFTLCWRMPSSLAISCSVAPSTK